MGIIEDLGPEAQKEVIKLHGTGMSYNAIADEISLKHKSEVTKRQIETYLNRKKGQTIKVLKEDKNFQSKLQKRLFDTTTQLEKLNSEMWELFYKLKKDPEFVDKRVMCPKCNHKFTVKMKQMEIFLKTADILLRQIKHVDEILGKTQKSALNITYNHVELTKQLTQVLPKILENAEKKNLCKINKKKMKKYIIP